MPSLNDHQSSRVIRILNVGESGTGKTGALASLAKVGYRLHILDFDNGLDILANILRDDPAAMSRVEFETIREETTLDAGIAKFKNVQAWSQVGKTLKAWDANSWGPNDILVIDTLSTMSQLAFNHALKLNSRLPPARPHESDYGWMADSVLMLIDNLTSDDNNFNVIVNTHVRYLRGEEETKLDDKGNETPVGAIKGLPNAKGQAIARDIGKYFNTLLVTTSTGSGQGTRRFISTIPTDGVLAKTASLKVDKTYPLDTGLAKLFADILGHSPSSTDDKPVHA